MLSNILVVIRSRKNAMSESEEQVNVVHYIV